MKQQFVACMLVASMFVPALSFAQDTLRLVDAVRKAAAKQAAAAQPAAKAADRSNHYFWPGIVMLGGGATLMAIGARHHQVAVGPSTVRYRFRF